MRDNKDSKVWLRDILIHEYFDVDLDIAWNTLKNDLPIFKKAIQELLQ